MPLTVLSVAYPLAPVSEATAGGAEQVLLTLDRGIVQRGHRSLVLAARGSRCSGLLLPVETPLGKLDETAKCEARRAFRSALKQALETFTVDVIHMHGIDFAEYLPDCDVPIVVTLHLPLGWYSSQALRPFRDNVSLVCVSHSQARTAPLDSRISRVIGNGVDLQRFVPARRKGDYVLFMGRICPEKGVHLAIDAAERAREKLLIAGALFDYPEHREYFETLVRPRLGKDTVFIGALGGKRKADLLAGARCLLVPSLARETSSLIAMEAMASGTPVVAWRSGALPEIIADCNTGFLVSSVEEMSAAISQAGNLNLIDSRRVAEHRFSADNMVTAYLDLYRELKAGASIPQLQAAA